MLPTELKEWRRSLGLTQEEAGNKFGVSRVTIQNWESGETPISKNIEIVCGFYLEKWKKQQMQRPDYGPVLLMFFDASLWIGPDGRFGMPHQEPFANNGLALKWVEAKWGDPKFHNPRIYDGHGNLIWEFPDLQAEIEKRRVNENRKSEKPGLAVRLMEIGRHFSSLPVYDDRSPDEIIGYDEKGLPR